MKIKKFGHSAIRVEESNTNILVDPGVWSPGVENETGLSAICITHEHADHFSIEHIKKLKANNTAEVFTNSAVAELLQAESIEATIVADGDTQTVGSISFSVHGEKHALIDTDWPQPLNTGFLFNETIYHPGDALHNPGKQVPVLAIPIMAPWARIGEMLDYIREIHPKKFFPIHEAMLKELGLYELQAKRVGESVNSEYVLIKEGDTLTI